MTIDTAAWPAGRVNSLGFAKPPHETRVVAAMSGGVDSSVVAAMLKAEGYDVIGITLQLYDHGAAIEKKGACCAGQDIHDARNVSDAIGIPHYVLDYESRFREQVMEDFADTYLSGSTPIPCIRCNQTVKFADLLATAKELGADCLATGHYIRRTDGPEGPELHRAQDASRDQSYFLFATTRAQLDFLRFPLGSLPKSEVRELAEKFALQVAAKPDSQDICFVPDGSYAKVVEKLRPGSGRGGEIVHLDGRVLGKHEGVIHYTIGQRRGLGVATGDPLFVVKIDAPARRVIVGPREALMTRGLLLEELNWLGQGSLEEAATHGARVLIRVRSTRPPVPGRLGYEDGVPAVFFDAPEEGVARGQAAVLYDLEGSTRILGGGFIARPLPADERVVAA
ncbi:tRNA (5-methylaminomethyl-2-thiouridylate)-methyltransferase [Hyphomonas neptunium ATCC 15444]|uniref:tRNA-specific 2-thiouridylase MnmA n=2 Tax=Hyphomonas TaxID=85 RepID=MNMA_HYPNA|nr:MULTISPECIES: tRNA 2-thiouridine(34) synthase MnmA [Hyphomonas]Q0C4H3.1 RecName: Full=tRNA-specific 2-thiouridylase MnmA [Hyphomonas neptunium ATCC 15444]ABI77026.1 tRNA (5-methylaminomethyl-2-thiouridylate)-methyltransferase [Hyphomonas neptunium ATCC 15444]KCZ96418.1 tRNA-specific 2-thiouridylase MnmA [Hyphomonas hirschiana VP5]